LSQSQPTLEESPTKASNLRPKVNVKQRPSTIFEPITNEESAQQYSPRPFSLSHQVDDSQKRKKFMPTLGMKTSAP